VLDCLPRLDGFCYVLRSVCRDETVFFLCDSDLSREHLALSSPPNSIIRNIIQKIEKELKATFATPKCLLDEHANTHAEQSQGRMHEWYRGSGCGFCYFLNIFTNHRPVHLKDKNPDDSHTGISIKSTCTDITQTGRGAVPGVHVQKVSGRGRDSDSEC